MVFDSGLFAPIRENMTSSTKPEVNILYSRQRRTEPRPLVTCVENLVKFGHVVCEISERTHKQTNNRQTNIRIAILRTPTGGEVYVSRMLLKITANDLSMLFRKRIVRLHCKAENVFHSY